MLIPPKILEASLRISKLLTLLYITVLLAACTFTTPAVQLEAPSILATSSFTEIDCTQFQGSFDDTFTCGYVAVLPDVVEANRTQPQPVQIAVVIANATAPEILPDPIIILPDGPGGDIIINASAFQSMIDIGQPGSRAVIWFDARGTGFSWPSLTCHDDLNDFVERTLRTPSPEAGAYFDGYASTMQSCFAHWRNQGIDFAEYTTVQNAQDVLAITQALGYEHFNLMAWGYGTSVAVELLRDPSVEGTHPECGAHCSI